MLASKAVLAWYEAADLLFSDNYGDTWRVLESAGKRVYTSLAISSNGEVMTATYANSLSAGGIITSRDKGKTWAESVLLDEACHSVDMSPDGKTQVAVGNLKKIIRSVDYGKTWTFIEASESTHWRAVAISDDGVHITAVPTTNGARCSYDSGETWKRQIGANAPIPIVGMSNDGKYQYAYLSAVYRSETHGKTWSKTNIYGKDGIVVLGDGKDVLFAQGNSISKSTNYGIKSESIKTISGYIGQLASSSDGEIILMGNQTENSILSKDGGITWNEIPNSSGWFTVAINK